MKSAAAYVRLVRPGVYQLTVHAKPGARSSSFAAVPTRDDAAVEIRLAAPPVEGAANAELVDFLQDALQAQRRASQTQAMQSANETTATSSFDRIAVRLVRGTTSRNKVVELGFSGTEDELVDLITRSAAS